MGCLEGANEASLLNATVLPWQRLPVSLSLDLIFLVTRILAFASVDSTFGTLDGVKTSTDNELPAW